MQYAGGFVLKLELAFVLLLRIHARASPRKWAHLLEPLMVNVFTLDV